MPALVILLAAQAMAVMDGSILVVASPSLRSSLHASGADVQLVVAMYTLAFGALVVTGSRLGDRVGRRRAFLAGLGAFTACSLAGGLAPSPGVLIVVRGLQGTAGAVMTPQVLSIIQARFEGERRARAIGAYSMILAVGVAAGQILGGLLVCAHLLAAAWRPALLINVPVGTVLLTCRRSLPAMPTDRDERLDLRGAALATATLLALIVPLVLGRGLGWPGWVWPCLLAGVVTGAAFVAWERRVAFAGGRPLLDLALLRLPGVAAGVLAVAVIMAAYAGFLLSVTLYLQGALRFSALHAGLTFAVYAAGFATASLSWPHAGESLRRRLPPLGALAMALALLAVGTIAGIGGWPAAATAPLLFLAGTGHACGFSPLASRLTTAIDRTRTADLSGLILTANLIGQVVGVAAFTGIYLSASARGPGRALELTTTVIAAALLPCCALGWRASRRVRQAVA